MSSQLRTYQTRVVLDVQQEAFLAAYADLYGQVERTLYAAMRAGEDPDTLKSGFMKTHHLTARQYNAISRTLQGKITAVTALQALQIDELTVRITKAKQGIAKATDPAKIHHKKRRLATLEARLIARQQDRANGHVPLCFGSRKLFRKQFHLAENGYASHAEWLAEWQASRRSQFFVLGSKDETAGCQGCVAIVAADGRLALRLRLPDALIDGTHKYVSIPNVHFPYGQDHIIAALSAKQALSYRFLRDAKGWRVFVTTDMPEVAVGSRRQLGAVGIDINEDCLAVSEIDHYGNLVYSQVVPCVTYGKSTDQARAVIGDAVKAVIARAVTAEKPIVIEQLDFKKKKAAREGDGVRRNRMLSRLAYSRITGTITARAYGAGIEVIEVNPAYTSIIGAVNYSTRYGISGHQGAAIALARRGLGFREKPASAGQVPLPGGVQVTFALPVRNRAKHVWTQWAGIRRCLEAAHAAHRQVGHPTPSRPTAPALGAVCRLPERPRHASRQQHCSAGAMGDVPVSGECLFIVLGTVQRG